MCVCVWVCQYNAFGYLLTLTLTAAAMSGCDLSRYGLLEVVEKDTASIDANKMLVKLFQKTLEYRLSEDVFSRVSQRGGIGMRFGEWGSVLANLLLSYSVEEH